MALDMDAARHAIIQTGISLHASGLNVGTSGNLSVRIGDKVIVTPSGLDYESITPSDLVVVDMDGNMVDGTRRPSSEVPLHLTTYRCSDAQAIIHTHSKYAVAVGTITDELPAIHYTINILGGPVRVVPFEVFGSRELADAAADAFVDRQGILLRNHGAVTYGSDLAQALDRTIKLEWLAEVFWHASVAGTPSILTAAQLTAVRDQAARLTYQA